MEHAVHAHKMYISICLEQEAGHLFDAYSLVRVAEECNKTSGFHAEFLEPKQEHIPHTYVTCLSTKANLNVCLIRHRVVNT